MVTERMNSSYGKSPLPNWHLSKPALEKMRKERYGTEVRSEEELVEVWRYLHKSLYTTRAHSKEELEALHRSDIISVGQLLRTLKS